MTTTQKPQPDSVPSPDAGGHWTLRTERRLVRASGGSERFVLGEIVTPTAAAGSRATGARP